MNVPILRSSLHRRLGTLVLTVVLGTTAAFAIEAPAWAGDGRAFRGRGAMMRQAPFAGRGMRGDRPVPAAHPQQPREPVAQPQATPAEPMPEARQIDRAARPGRLTPDERRALRQQINDAGRDIYRPPRP